MGRLLRLSSWDCPGGLGSAPVRAGVEVVQLLGSQGSWQHQVLRGVGGWGSRKHSALEGHGSQCWPVRTRVPAWRPPPWQRSLAAHSLQGRKESSWTEGTLWAWHKILCVCVCVLVATLPQWELSVKVAQLLGLRGPWRCQVFRDMDCLHGRSYGPIRVFFQASCSWWSEGLFGQSFSIAPPIQALRRDPLPEVLLCCSACQALKGAPWVGSYSAVQRIRHLTGQPLYCSAADAGMWRERGYGDSSTPYGWLSSIALLPWLPGFPPQAFRTTISSLASPWAVSPQSTKALALGFLHKP